MKNFLLLVMAVMLSACGAQYSSMQNNAMGYEIIDASEEVVMQAAYSAILARLPGTVITKLAGYEKGFAFYAQPFIDRTNFKFTVNKVEGVTAQNIEESGYTFAVTSRGSQFAQRARYITPIVRNFRAELQRRGARTVWVDSVTF